jgi:CRP-like cAMP-binding protein
MSESLDHVQMLRHVPIFGRLSAETLESLARQMSEQTYDAGATILRQGDKGLGFYLIAHGQVDVSRDGRHVATLGPGSYFGEYALLEDVPRTATVTAGTQTRCLQLAGWHFRALLRGNPDIAIQMLETVVHRLNQHEKDQAHS